MDKEAPALCKACRQWLCANKDAFCSCCGAPLVAARFSTQELSFDAHGEAQLTITNTGLFQLYWAAEIAAPAAGARARFTITPDYGVIAPGGAQQVVVRLVPGREEPRALLEIASNDARTPQIEIALVAAAE